MTHDSFCIVWLRSASGSPFSSFSTGYLHGEKTGNCRLASESDERFRDNHEDFLQSMKPFWPG